MRASFFQIFLICSILGNYSCTGDISGEGEVSSGSTSLSIPNHIGQWRGCLDYDSNGDGIPDKSKLQVLNFSSSTLIDSMTDFNSVSCQIVNQSHKIEAIYKYTQSGSLFNFNLRAYIYTPLSVQKANTNNSSLWCSLLSWSINTPISILGRNCGGTTKNFNDSSSATINVVGNNLQLGGMSYSLESKPDFSEVLNVIPDGSYIYINGDEKAQMLVLQNKSYTRYHYDLENNYYMIENGTYTSKNNFVTLSISSTNPIYCLSGTSTLPFRAGSNSLMVNLIPDNDIFVGYKVEITEQLFRSLYLGGGFGIWCI